MDNYEKAQYTIKLLNERKRKRKEAKEKMADTLMVESILRHTNKKKLRMF